MSATTTPIRIGGVNEHFNFPWKKGIADGRFLSIGADLQWSDISGGTGEMTQLLREEKLDMAVLLTEGLFQDIARSPGIFFLQFFVQSPLRWGIHVRKEDADKWMKESLNGARFAISRYGSGSHLMTKVYFKEYPSAKKPEFVVVNSLTGGLNSLKEKSSDVFLWEKFTTAPFLEEYELACIGEVPTPWPCFSIAVSGKVFTKHATLIENICDLITKICTEIKSSATTAQEISLANHLPIDQAAQWLKETDWNYSSAPQRKVIEEVNKQLHEFGIIPANTTIHSQRIKVSA